MRNKLKLTCDIENNQLHIKDELGFIDESIQVVKGFEFTENSTDEYYRLYKKNVALLIGSDFDGSVNRLVVKMYLDDVEAKTDIEVDNPLDFKEMNPDEFESEFGVSLIGNTPVGFFIDSVSTKIIGTAVQYYPIKKDELITFISEKTPILYKAYKNEIGQYKIRYYVHNTSNNNSEDKQILSSTQYTII